MTVIALSPFEVWAAREGYDAAPAVVPTDIRKYADRDTQAAYEAYKAGAADSVRMVTESTLNTEALRQELLAIAREF
jgi:hypothetical protein